MKIKEIGARIDVIEASQFIAANVYEWSSFKADAGKVTMANIVAAYNRIIDQCETDSSLKINFGKQK